MKIVIKLGPSILYEKNQVEMRDSISHAQSHPLVRNFRKRYGLIHA